MLVSTYSYTRSSFDRSLDDKSISKATSSDSSSATYRRTSWQPETNPSEINQDHLEKMRHYTISDGGLTSKRFQLVDKFAKLS